MFSFTASGEMTARFWRGGVLPVVLLVVLLQEAQGVALERVAYYRTTNTTRRSSWKYIQGSSYRIALFLAQEEAKCLEAYVRLFSLGPN